ncbi:MAG: LysE family transporter [Cyclobacteriaceae bacterium]|jgi:threonine/homoserine/homoserine lactone efflux protein|nr:LysE family transporter [Cyclobacteriaceae bacterium]
MIVQVFLIGLIFSFLGSIPPGTLNLAVLQLGMEHKIKTAIRFSLAVAIIEYPYAWIAVVFEDWVTSSPLIIDNFQLITAVVMIVIGAFTLWSARKPSEFSVRFNESGFRRGIILSILNPMAIPFWIGVTAYLKAQGWVDLSTQSLLHSYVFGTSVGVIILLVLFTFLAKRLAHYIKDNRYVKLVPGFTLLVLGLYAFAKYLFH